MHFVRTPDQLLGHRITISASLERRLVGCALSIGLMAGVIPIVFSSDAFLALAREDGPVETIGAIGFALAGLLFAALAIKTELRRRWWFLALAIVLIFGAGEEISWGQRIFGWDPVDASLNVQRETNIHNIHMFDTAQGGWLKFSRLFHVFWCSWLVLLPLALTYNRTIRRLVREMDIPIAPLAFGIVMLLNFFLSKLVRVSDLDSSVLAVLPEVRECAQALALALVALWFWFDHQSSQRST